MTMNLKEFIKRLRYMPRVELTRLCKDSGMNDKEIYGVVSYIYDELSIPQIADNLNISVGQFHYRKELVAVRLRNYLKAIQYPRLEY
jgi:hypothetical protein